MLKHYSAKQKLKMIITLLLYLGFVYLVISAVVTNPNPESFLFAFFGVVCLVFGTLNEYLKLLNNEAMWYLNFKLDTKKAVEIYNKACHLDIFKIYEKERGLFDTMVACENKEYKKVFDIIAANEKKFNSNVETYLIRLYYEMRSCVALGRTKRINEMYFDVKNIEKMKKKPKIFQFDEFHAMHELALHNENEAYKHFQNVNMKYMNPKEKRYVLQNLIDLAPKNDKAYYQEQMDSLMDAVNESK